MPAPPDLFFVFLVPCLNEELVIARSLERLLSMPARNFAVLVVDDGSDDATSEVVRGYLGDRVWLLRREKPNARQGKGEALNAAYRYLRSSTLLEGRRPEDVVVAVVDADGRLEPSTLFEVAPYFRDPSVGAVQIGVRMYNADQSLLTRMQDLEFVTFTEIYQRARQRLGSVGLGGNGQFTRLAALESLGEAPWTRCLTEDLDLGVRLLVAGWRNSFCPTAHVSQQAVTRPWALIRQRARWFQGHLQCWQRIPLVLLSDLDARSRFDLVQSLLSPALVLLTSLLLPITGISIAAALLSGAGGIRLGPSTLFAAVIAYVLSFGLAPLYGFSYWLRDSEVSLPRALLQAHAYTIYGYMWFAAGWIAVWRTIRRRSGWAKTGRTADGALPAATAGAVVDLTAPAGDARVITLDPEPARPSEPLTPEPLTPEPALRSERSLMAASAPRRRRHRLARRSALVLAAALILPAGAERLGAWSATMASAGSHRDLAAAVDHGDRAGLGASLAPGAPVASASSTAAAAPSPVTPSAPAPNPTPAAAPAVPVSASSTPAASPQTPQQPKGPAPAAGPQAPRPAPAPPSTPPTAPTTTAAPRSCPQGGASWSGSLAATQSDHNHWDVKVTAQLHNGSNATMTVSSVTASISYEPDGSSSTYRLALSPSSTQVAPGATANFSASVTLQSDSQPGLSNLTLSKQWSDPWAASACPGP